MNNCSLCTNKCVQYKYLEEHVNFKPRHPNFTRNKSITMSCCLEYINSFSDIILAKVFVISNSKYEERADLLLD